MSLKIISLCGIFACFYTLHAEHWEVFVYLKNKTILKGVVLDNKFHEIFIEKEGIWQSTPSPENAGIRLWYVSDSSGFIYLKYREIREVEKIRKLDTPPQDSPPKPLFETPRSPEEYPPFEEEYPPPTTTPSEEDPPSLSSGQEEQLLQKAHQLLQKYPPRFWNFPHLRTQIRTQVASQIPLAPELLEFFENYEEWRSAQELLLYGEKLHYTPEECQEILQVYGNLLNLFPPQSWNLKDLWKRARRKSIRNTANTTSPYLSVEDSEFLVHYENWFLALQAKKALDDGSAAQEKFRRATFFSSQDPSKK